MKDETSLDEVSVFGGKLSFLIPHNWEELDTAQGNFYAYSQPKTDSGWFRVSLNTSTGTALSGPPAERLKRIFEKRGNVSRDKETGNLIHAYERDAEEDGARIHLYYWIVANVVEPNLVREAVFSYTVLHERINDENTVRIVALLSRLVRKACFSPCCSTPD